MKTILYELYLNLKHYQDFPKEGVDFIDILPITSDGRLREILRNCIINTIPKDIDVIVAPESRGFILAYMLPNYTIIPLRKEGKLPGPTIKETYTTEYSTDTLEVQQIDLTNKHVWFIDDIFATGGTYNIANKLVNRLGGELIGGTVLLNIFNKQPEHGIIKELFIEVKDNEK